MQFLQPTIQAPRGKAPELFWSRLSGAGLTFVMQIARPNIRSLLAAPLEALSTSAACDREPSSASRNLLRRSGKVANLALELTRNGWSLQALTSFWAFRAQPLLAAQLQR